MLDIAVGSAELRLIGLDDGVGVEQVELAWLEAVLSSLRRERDLGPARWRLLVAVVAHASPLVGEVGGGFGVLVGQHAGGWVPPAHGPVGGAERAQQRAVVVVDDARQRAQAEDP